VDISDNGVKFIAGFEGFEENFYTDDAVSFRHPSFGAG
jgi:GH24 family phage-related lysozyme (muramidase)